MRSIANKIEFQYESLEDAFPEVDPGHVPFGPFVIVQIRTPKRRTASGIEIPDDVRETEHYNTQVAKVVAIGPGAFRTRAEGTIWPEGEWFEVGAFVRCPKYGGDRWSVKFSRRTPEQKVGNLTIPEKVEQDEAIFVLFKDMDCRAGVSGDPRKIKAFL